MTDLNEVNRAYPDPQPYGWTIQEKNENEETGEVTWSLWKTHIYKTENYAKGALKISRKVTNHGIDAEYRVLPLFITR